MLFRSYHPGYTGKGRQFFGSALRVAPGNDYARSVIVGGDFSNRVASLGVGGGRYRAGVDDDDVSDVSGCRCIAPLQELIFEHRSIGLGGAASELFDKESGHDSETLSQLEVIYEWLGKRQPESRGG